jgi:Tfp pilus assembly protein PilO
MTRILLVLTLIVYMGWFHTVSVDKDQIQKDKDKAVDKV